MCNASEAQGRQHLQRHDAHVEGCTKARSGGRGGGSGRRHWERKHGMCRRTAGARRRVSTVLLEVLATEVPVHQAGQRDRHCTTNSAERVCTSKPTQVREARAKRAPRLARGSDTAVAEARGARGEWDTSSRLPTGGTLRTRVGEEGRNPQGRKHELEELQRVLAAECPRANEACPHQHTAPTSRTPPPSRRNTRTAHGTRRQTQEAR